MEFLREDLTLTDDVYAETEIQCPVGRSENIVMAIHAIEFQHNITAGITAGDQMWLALSKKSKTAVPDTDQTQLSLSDPDLIAAWGYNITGATLLQFRNNIGRVDFKIPILVANNKLYFCGKGDEMTKAHIRIHYTLRRVSRAELYDALVD